MNNINLKPILDKLNDLTCIIDQDMKLICKHYGFIDTTDDVRVTFYHKIQNVITPTTYSMIFLDSSLHDKQWWIDHTKNKTDTEIQRQQLYYEFFIKIGFLQISFMAVESTLRTILRKIKPNACNKSTGEFYSVYSCLFKEINGYKHFKNTLDFFRLLRNTLYNNGMYSHKSNKPKNINWNLTTYSFIPDQKISFATWELLFDILTTILNEIKVLFTCEQLSKLQNTIPDPFVH